MSEIKFACPHCSQHIACDDLYCGERIDCPGCRRELFIPPRATFVPLQACNMTLTLPVAFKERLYPRSATLDLWSEEEWERHAGESDIRRRPTLLPLWVLLLLPFFVAFILVSHRAGMVAVEWCFILSALAFGFYLAKVREHTGAGAFLVSLLYSFAMLAVYVIMAVRILFVGCLVLIR
jgi:hypothetical protein